MSVQALRRDPEAPGFRSRRFWWLQALVVAAPVALFWVSDIHVKHRWLESQFNPLLVNLLATGAVGLGAFAFARVLFTLIDRADAELQTERRRLDALFRHTSDGILVLDSSLRILSMNPAAEALTGWQAEDVAGRMTVCELLGCRGLPGSPPCPARSLWCRRPLESRRPVSYFELTAQARDGRLLPLSASLSVLPSSGSNYDLVMVIRDLSNQRRLEESLAVMEERYRLARELHDGLAQQLGYVSFRAGALASRAHRGGPGPGDGLAEDLRDLYEALRRLYREVRQSIHDLKTPLVPDQEPWDAVLACAEGFQRRTGIPVELRGTPEPLKRYSRAAQLHLLRVVQEALTNVHKHASASRVIISVEQEPEGSVALSVTDDGVGFEPSRVRQGGGIHWGLLLMEERAELAGGRLRVISAPGQGTSVVVRLGPAQETAHPGERWRWPGAS